MKFSTLTNAASGLSIVRLISPEDGNFAIRSETISETVWSFNLTSAPNTISLRWIISLNALPTFSANSRLSSAFQLFFE